MPELLMQYKIKKTGHVIAVYAIKIDKLDLPGDMRGFCDSSGYLKIDITEPIQGRLRQTLSPGRSDITIFEITLDPLHLDQLSHPWCLEEIPIPDNVKLPYPPPDRGNTRQPTIGNLITWGMIEGESLRPLHPDFGLWGLRRPL